MEFGGSVKGEVELGRRAAGVMGYVYEAHDHICAGLSDQEPPHVGSPASTLTCLLQCEGAGPGSGCDKGVSRGAHTGTARHWSRN